MSKIFPQSVSERLSQSTIFNRLYYYRPRNGKTAEEAVRALFSAASVEAIDIGDLSRGNARRLPDHELGVEFDRQIAFRRFLNEL